MRDADSVVIRHARPSDAPVVAGLFRQVVGGLDIYNAPARAAAIEQFSASGLAALMAGDEKSVTLACRGNDPVGFAITEDQHGPILIAWYGVRADARGQGVGQALVENLIAAGAARRATKLWCDTRTDNAASIALFQKLGFHRLCELKNHWHGQDFFLWEHILAHQRVSA